MLASKLTTKYQATIPLKVRNALKLSKGDALLFQIKKNGVLLKKAAPLDLKFAKSLQKTLSEWESENDEEAYRDL